MLTLILIGYLIQYKVIKLKLIITIKKYDFSVFGDYQLIGYLLQIQQ